VRVIEVADRSGATLSTAEILSREADDIEQTLARQKVATPLYLLDIRGRLIDSEDMAALLSARELSGNPQIGFIIGGSVGVDDRINRLVEDRLSFGRITLPHNLARIVLLEQLYRACRIKNNEPYHK